MFKFRFTALRQDLFFTHPFEVGYALVVWANGETIIKGYETEYQARRALKYQLDKYDRWGMGASGQVYPTQLVEEVSA